MLPILLSKHETNLNNFLTHYYCMKWPFVILYIAILLPNFKNYFEALMQSNKAKHRNHFLSYEMDSFFFELAVLFSTRIKAWLESRLFKNCLNINATS